MKLAEDGSPDIQYDLGRQLLGQNSVAEEDISTDHIQGINWLMKAAEQNHEGALVLLSECLQTKRGITSRNEAQVRNCLSMTPGERAARRAASELFASLSNGTEFVTVEELERKMREIYNLTKKKKKHSDQDVDEDVVCIPDNLNIPRSRSIDETNQISEQNLVTAAVDYSHGQLPEVTHALNLSVPHPRMLDHFPVLHRLFCHPLLFFSLLYHRLIELFSSFTSFTNLSKFQILIALFIYAFVSTENSILFLPMVVYYSSLTVMLISTFKMLKSKHDFIDFRIWSGLFLRYGEDIQYEQNENLYIRNNLVPYFTFFIAFGVNLMVHPYLTDQWLPHSEITTISFIFTFITLIAFMYTSTNRIPDFLIIFSFSLNVLAKFPYELDIDVINFWRFLDLKVPAFSTFVIGNGIEFCLNHRGLFYIFINLLLFQLAKRNNWQGFFQYLIPHCVTLAWLQICIISSQEAEMFGLMRSVLGLAGLLLFLPLFGIATLLIPVFAAVEWFSLDTTFRFLVITMATIFAIVISCFLAVSNRTGKYITSLQIVIFLLASVFLTYPYINSEEKYGSYLKQIGLNGDSNHAINSMPAADIPDGLNWENYHKYCLSNIGSYNRIGRQIRCSHLHNTLVYWEGSVADVRIFAAHNFRSDLIFNYLPQFLANGIACYFGEKNDVGCYSEENCDEMNEYIERQKKCNLDKWNT